jgi:hypothetical protein
VWSVVLVVGCWVEGVWTMVKVGDNRGKGVWTPGSEWVVWSEGNGDRLESDKVLGNEW